MLKLGRYLKDFKKEVILGPLFKLMEAVFELLVPLVMARIIDVGIAGRETAYVLRMGGLMVLLGVVGLVCALTCQYYAAKASQGFGTIVRRKLYAHINALSHAEVDRIGTASLITRLTGDVNQLQVGVAMLIRLAIRAPFLVIGSAVMAMLLDLKLSLVFLAATPLVALVLWLVMSRSVPFYRGIQKKLDRISLITRENLEGVRVIRAFSKQKSEQNRFDGASDALARSSVAVGKISALLNPLTFLIMNLSIVAVLWFGGMRVYDGALSQGQIIAFVNYMTQILLALVVVANLVVIFTKASASAARVSEVLETTPSVRETASAAGKIGPVPGAPRISFEDVSFSYGDGDYALRDISVAIAPGETIGIIGGTGSGKSTLVNLIPRFYDVAQGRICIDGVDIREYPLHMLRNKCGIVPQKAVLFTGSVRENMRWRDPQADDEQIERALATAQAAEFVQGLPHGLDTKILQGGKNLSGGQKQRLTIARALVGSPEILILDDSASALDFATDAALRRAIARDTEGMTVLMVSQRASTIQNADKIIVLDDGEVAGIGTHAALLQSCAVYREICQSQLGGEANES